MTIHDVYTHAHNCELVLSELTHKKSNHYFDLLFFILLTCLHIHFLLQYFYFLLYYYHLFLLVLIAMYFLKFYLCIDPYGTYTAVYFKHFSYLRTSLSFLTYRLLLTNFYLSTFTYLRALIFTNLFIATYSYTFIFPICLLPVPSSSVHWLNLLTHLHILSLHCCKFWTEGTRCALSLWQQRTSTSETTWVYIKMCRNTTATL